MLRSRWTAALCGCALLACAGSAQAQGGASALSLGGRVLAAAPVGDRGAGLETGVGFGVDAGYEVRPGLVVYAGYSRTVFPVEQEGRDADRVDSGIDLGVLTRRPVGGVPLWFRGGIVFHEAETHLRSGGGGLDDGTTGVGLESGVGAEVRLGRHVMLLPGVGYTAYPVGDPGGVSHLRAEVGVRLRP
ncbi:MAG TPA: outer membrane beta-barrel protein [Longimicrobiaceae bacterium]|nr:outer membrane beta-barrel protein [Longimicrobiaceae bacterium]